MHPAFAPQFRKPTGLFGHLAARYMIKRNGFVHEGIERFAEFENGLSALEIGFGPGVGLRYFLDRYDIELDGIDFYMSNKSRLERNPLTAGPVFKRYDSREVLDSLGRVGFTDARAHCIVDDSGDFLVITANV